VRADVKAQAADALPADIAEVVKREVGEGLMASGLTAQLRVSTEEELQAKLAEAKEELFNLRFQGATGQLESHGRLRAVRKEIARIYTVMRERELGIITLIEESGEPEDLEPQTPAATAEAGPATDDAAEDDDAEEASE
jgi:large subunit ribosomal protein L29